MNVLEMNIAYKRYLSDTKFDLIISEDATYTLKDKMFINLLLNGEMLGTG